MRTTLRLLVTLSSTLPPRLRGLSLVVDLCFETESLSWPDGLVSCSLFISARSIGLRLCFRENLIYGLMLLSFHCEFERARITGEWPHYDLELGAGKMPHAGFSRPCWLV